MRRCPRRTRRFHWDDAHVADVDRVRNRSGAGKRDGPWATASRLDQGEITVSSNFGRNSTPQDQQKFYNLNRKMRVVEGARDGDTFGFCRANSRKTAQIG
jgi:hypothetical protein